MKETLKKQRLFFISLVGIVVVSLIMGTTFAYQTIMMNESEHRNIVLQAGVLDVSFETTNVIENTNMPLLSDYTKADYLEFTVDNTKSNADAAFKVNLIELDYGYINSSGNKVKGCTSNTCISNKYFKYKIEEVDSNNNYSGNFAKLSSTSPYTEEYSLTNYITIEKGTTKTYRLYLWLHETQGNQNSLENTYFKGKINITSLFKDDLTEDDVENFVNPFDEGTLAYEIIDNSITGINGTRFVKTPISKIAEEKNSYNWEYGKEMLISFDGEYIYGITEDPTKSVEDFEECLYGVWDDEIGDYVGEGDCTGIITDDLSCENSIGKYFFDDMYWEIYGPVDSCVDGVPMKKIKPESVLSITEDDEGPSYYYRGNVEDNYLNFAGKCWRIVRIAGDGSIKIILEDAYNKCDDDEYTGNWSIGEADYGFEAVNISTTGTFYTNSLNYLNNSTTAIKYKLDNWLKGSGIDTNKLKYDTWCLGDSGKVYDYDSGALLTDSREHLTLNNLKYGQFIYDGYKRIKGVGQTPTATLKCYGLNQTTSFIGTLTADEVVYAGAKFIENNDAYYLTGSNDNSRGWWTLTPSYRRYQNSNSIDEIFYVSSGYLGSRSVCYYKSCKSVSGTTGSGYSYRGLVRPAITLKKDTYNYIGSGTKLDPYEVK